MKRLQIPILMSTLLLLSVSSAGAATIWLSEFSSDSTPADLLDAQIDFQVSGNTLTLTVENFTEDPNAYDLTEIYWNAATNVSGLTLDSPTGDWALSANAKGGGIFGRFDFALKGGVIEPGESVDFELTISGTGPFDMMDFVELSRIPPGSQPVLAQVKFISGPGDDSGFGGTATGETSTGNGVLPEPGILATLSLGLLCTLRRARR